VSNGFNWLSESLQQTMNYMTKSEKYKACRALTQHYVHMLYCFFV